MITDIAAARSIPARLTSAGDFLQGDFMTVSRGTGADMHTMVTFEPLLPTLTEGVRVDPAKINGVTNELFLSGDGLTNFTFEFKSGVSAYANTLGYYKIAADGTISDVHVLIDNTLNVPASARTVKSRHAGGRAEVRLLPRAGRLRRLRPTARQPVVRRAGEHIAGRHRYRRAAVLRSASMGNLTNAPVFHSVATLNRAMPIRSCPASRAAAWSFSWASRTCPAPPATTTSRT